MNKSLSFIAIALWLLMLAPPALPQGGGIPHCNTLTSTANNSQCASTAFVQQLVNGSTNAAPNVGPWNTTFTPSVTCRTGGAFTTASGVLHYKLIGNKTLVWSATITITSVGTCTDFTQFSVPFNPISPMMGTCREGAVTNNLVSAISNGGNLILLIMYNGTATGNANYVFQCTGIYETT